MKAYLEIVELKVNDVITTSTPDAPGCSTELPEE